MMTLPDLELLTRKYADARGRLAGLITELNDIIERAKRERLARVKELVAVAAEREANLRSAIEGSPELFEKPRTLIFHGVKIGYVKQRGKIEWDDPDRVVELIRAHFNERGLLRVSYVPDRASLAGLTVAELKKIGCRATEDGDKAVVLPVDSEVDKIVSALLKDAAAIEAN